VPFTLTLIEEGRALLSAPPPGRGKQAAANGPADPKWKLGDLLLRHVPKAQVAQYARAIGGNMGRLREYRAVAAAWPPAKRKATHWTTHRELMDRDDRFTLIQPGMTMRDACKAIGKPEIDRKAKKRLSLADAAADVIVQLLSKPVCDQVIEDLLALRTEQKAKKKRAVHAARLAEDVRDAEVKRAQREFRKALQEKSPQRVYIEAQVKLREMAQYVRATAQAATDVLAPMVPPDRLPELIEVMSVVADAVSEALADLQGAAGVIDVEEVPPRRPLAQLRESNGL
jgi:hypothetical protein